MNTSFAHSGRTDSQGGHHDRKNGGYHFHHGKGPHQHPNGSCPFESKDKGSNTGLYAFCATLLAFGSYKFYQKIKS